MAVTAILLDKNKPISMWICLVIGTTNGVEDIGDTRWVQVRALPKAVKSVPFPVWAKPSTLFQTNDIVTDYLNASRAGSKAFGDLLATAALVEVVSLDQDNEDEKPPAKTAKTSSTKSRTPTRKGSKTGGRVGDNDSTEKKGKVQELQWTTMP